MDPTIFTPEAWGALTAAPEGFAAFVPDPAPRTFALSDAAVGLLDEASNELGALRGIGSRLPNPRLLIAPSLRREAVLSSRIEGTQTSMSDVYAAEAEQLELIEARDYREVLNYVRAYEWGLASLDELPLSFRLIKGLHQRLMAGVRGHERHPGEFRRYQNWIGGGSGADARYVPPPVPQMLERMDDFERFVNERPLRPLVQAAVLHYQFEAIHPFGDGNGRVGRLLVSLFLAQSGLLPQPLLYLSEYLEHYRDAYYDGLLRVSTHGDWDGWVRFFLTGIRDQARAAADSTDRLLSLQARYRDELLAARGTSNTLVLLDELFMNPIIDTGRAQDVLEVSAPTARAALRALEEQGILREVTGRRWRRTYRADEIYAAVTASTG